MNALTKLFTIYYPPGVKSIDSPPPPTPPLPSKSTGWIARVHKGGVFIKINWATQLFTVFSKCSSICPPPGLDTLFLLFSQHPAVPQYTRAHLSVIYGLIFLSSRKGGDLFFSAVPWWRLSGRAAASSVLLPPGSARSASLSPLSAVRSHPPFPQLGTATNCTWTDLCMAGDQLVSHWLSKIRVCSVSKILCTESNCFLGNSFFDPGS